jgi:hypothetical protein
MAETESSIAIQDEENGNTASIITSEEDITVNWIVWLNPDGSSINPEEEGEW